MNPVMSVRCVLGLRVAFGRLLSEGVASPGALLNYGGRVEHRALGTSTVRGLKEIVVEEKDDVTVVEGRYVESPRASLLVQSHTGTDCQACPLCALNLNLKHTDVLILSQFLRDDGCMYPRRVTGLCARQQRRVSLLVAMSQKAGLMFNLNPSYSKKDPKLRNRSKKYNRYFDEATLPC